MAVCDVCRLINRDISVKWCFYCPRCDSDICMDHENDWLARGRAAILRQMEKWNGVSA
jgi:hypothetical protein